MLRAHFDNFGVELCSFPRITYCHLPFQSKFLYIGTERGNIHIVNVESFTLSGYVIMWNKAIEL
jgi:syntaxin-binding protein 5